MSENNSVDAVAEVGERSLFKGIAQGPLGGDGMTAGVGVWLYSCIKILRILYYIPKR